MAEILSDMFVELGDFQSASKYLKAALQQIIPSDVDSSPDIIRKRLSHGSDPTFTKLQIMLATVYLQSFSFDDGVRILEGLMLTNPPMEIWRTISQKLIRVQKFMIAYCLPFFRPTLKRVGSMKHTTCLCPTMAVWTVIGSLQRPNCYFGDCVQKISSLENIIKKPLLAWTKRLW